MSHISNVLPVLQDFLILEPSTGNRDSKYVCNCVPGQKCSLRIQLFQQPTCDLEGKMKWGALNYLDIGSVTCLEDSCVTRVFWTAVFDSLVLPRFYGFSQMRTVKFWNWNSPEKTRMSGHKTRIVREARLQTQCVYRVIKNGPLIPKLCHLNPDHFRKSFEILSYVNVRISWESHCLIPLTCFNF